MALRAVMVRFRGRSRKGNHETSAVLWGSQLRGSPERMRPRNAGETHCWFSSGRRWLVTQRSRDGDSEADFFAGFADGTGFERFEEVEFAADDAPAASLGRKFAEGQEHASACVEQKHTYANFGNWGERGVCDGRDGKRAGAGAAENAQLFDFAYRGAHKWIMARASRLGSLKKHDPVRDVRLRRRHRRGAQCK
jgi:hypothetical protein